ncbi:MAG: hypothetical protein AMXMBFR75_27380 [Candidatus Hinthialibacteria bacterium]
MSGINEVPAIFEKQVEEFEGLLPQDGCSKIACAEADARGANRHIARKKWGELGT